jgi:pimeloyl-ACP methyl ester carboxylesterase
MSIPAPDDPQDPSSDPAPGPSPEQAPGPAPEPEPPVPPAATSGAGTPLVLLHAFPLDGRMWAPQVEALAGSYQVVVPDLRGFGAARDQAVEEAGMDLLADDLARLLDDRGLDRVVLGGLSMGGYVALAFMRRHADRVSGLVLLGTKATADGDQARDARLAMAERVLAEGNGFVPEAMLPRLLGETSRESRPELVERVTALILEQSPEAIAGAQRGMAARAATSDVLASIKVPTLVVTGEEDAVTGPEVGRDLAAGIPGARFLLVEQAGHLSNLERPEVVNEALLDFLAPLWV